MGTSQWLRASRLVSVLAGSLLLLAAECMTDVAAPGFYVRVVGTGSGTGTVTAVNDRIACTVVAGVSEGDCEEAYINEMGHHFYAAVPAAGSVFRGWVGFSASDASLCTDATATTCEIVTGIRDSTFNIRPHFALANVTDHRLMLAVAELGTVSSAAAMNGWTVASPDRAIICHLTADYGSGQRVFHQSANCMAMYAAGSTVVLTASGRGSTAEAELRRLEGCTTSVPDCTVVMDQDRGVTLLVGPPYTSQLGVAPQGAGSGRVVSAPSGIDCLWNGSAPSGACTVDLADRTVVTLSATPASGSAFVGWSGGSCSGTASTCVVTMAAAASVTATFDLTAPATLSVTFAGTGTGTVTSSPAGINCANFSGGGSIACTASYASGTAVTLTATPNGSSIFTGWGGGGCTGSGTCIVTMSGAKSVQATFGLPSFALTVSGAGTGGGIVTEAASGIACTIVAGATSGICTALVQSGLVAIPIPTPAQGSVFSGWSGDCTGTSTCFLPMDQARSVTATFTTVTTFTLTIRQGQTFMGSGSVASTPAGIACTFTSGQTTPTGSCAFAFPAGTAVTLAAGAAPPSTFATWLGAPGCGFGNPVCIVTMDQDRAVDVVINP